MLLALRPLGLAALLLCACGGDDASTASGAASSGADAGGAACAPGELLLDSGACLQAGTQENGCSAGEIFVEGSGCRPAGVPPDACARGFEPDATGGCAAILPATPCPKGKMAVPGETTCRDVAPCGSGSWGDIPVEGDTAFVDALYTGGGSDGSPGKPWTTIQDAIDAAPPGAIVAIASGSYAEDLTIVGQPVRLWGRCPALVEIVGSAAPLAAIFVKYGADGTEVRDLAVRAATIGIGISGSEGLLLDRLWIHDTAQRGLDVEDGLGPTEAALKRSLVESATELGVFVSGAKATLDGTVVRDTKPRSSDQRIGRGIGVQHDPNSGDRANVVVASSVVENNRDDGVFVSGSDATLEATVVRDTQPQADDQAFGRGITIQRDAPSGERANVAVRSCVVDGNHYNGVYVEASDATIEDSVVRNTQPQQSDQEFGRGIGVQNLPGTGERANLTVRSSLLDQNHDVGLFVAGSDAVIESTVVRGTEPQASDQASGAGVFIESEATGHQRASVALRSCVVDQNHEVGIAVVASDATVDATVVQGTQPQTSDQLFGSGIYVQSDPDNAERANVTVRSCVVAKNHEVGVGVVGSDATIEATVVRDTLPEASEQAYGQGVHIQDSPTGGQRAAVSLRGCVVDDNRNVGIMVVGSDATVEASVVRRTRPDATHGVFGDGISVLGLGLASAMVTHSRVEGSTRAGIASFGGKLSLGTTVLECNGLDLDGEAVGDTAASFEDLGGDVCGCAGATNACALKSASLAPPAVLPELPSPP